MAEVYENMEQPTEQPAPEEQPQEDQGFRGTKKELANEELHRFLLTMYDSVLALQSVISIPTDSNIEMLFKFSLGLFALTGLLNLCRLFTLISWQGAGINVILLAILLIREKGEQNILTNTYRKAEQTLKQQLKRRKHKQPTTNKRKRKRGTKRE